ncbi:bromodomain-containing protein 8 isoform X2 [Electrophorus electricus]|nr:bromodomain-containing protein 8 isoform X2 [Electrophorus electricus]
MASGLGKHKLQLGPTEPWSIREKLCLASSVMKSGDQNWVSVSRAIKPFAEPGRPPDWFSQKHCASQYSELLECTEAPKRKRGEKGEVVETVEDVIVRRLTAERIEELKKLIRDTQEKHRKLKREAELVQAGHQDSRVEELWEEIVQSRKKEEEEEEVKRKATDAAYQARLALKSAPKRAAGVGLRSPPGAALGDAAEQPGTAASGAGAALPTPVAEQPGPRAGGRGRGCRPEDRTQRKPLGQKGVPPPSPLLSELLKKDGLLNSGPWLVEDVECPTGQGTGIRESQPTSSSLPSSQTVTGKLPVAERLLCEQSDCFCAPTLSRLLEAGPSQFPSQLSSPATADSASSAPPPAAVASAVNAAGVDGGHSVESKASMLEEDLVTLSCMTDELDLETVGDIIVIIENKEGDEAEALEAALSLPENTGHTLSSPWEPVGSEAPSAGETVLTPSPHPNLEDGTVGVGVPQDPCSSSEGCGHPSSSSCPSGEMPGACSEPEPPSAAIQSDGGDWTQSQADSHPKDNSTARQLSKDITEEAEEMEASLSDAKDGSVSETRGLGGGTDEQGGDVDGEGAQGLLPEAQLEPAASKSEVGCSMHTVCSSLQLHTAADSTPSSPASSQFSISSEDQEAIQAQKTWKKAIMLVWRAAANHRYANVFLQPVTDDIAPGYHSIVHRPMDLSTIKKNIENGLIRTTAEFQRDIMLMFQNAVMYNSSDHDVFHMALEMQRDVLEQVQQYLATQLVMQTSESGISAKSLRGREANRKQDPSDKVTRQTHTTNSLKYCCQEPWQYYGPLRRSRRDGGRKKLQQKETGCLVSRKTDARLGRSLSRTLLPWPLLLSSSLSLTVVPGAGGVLWKQTSR